MEKSFTFDHKNLYQGPRDQLVSHRFKTFSSDQNLKIDELAQMNSWFETVLNCLGDGVIATRSDVVRSIEFMNPIAEFLTGYTLKEARGLPLEQVLQIKDQSGPVHLKSKDGKDRVIECTSTLLQNPSDTVRGSLHVIRDATEKYRLLEEQNNLLIDAENARQELAAFFMQAPAPMAILTGPQHIYALANPLYVHFIGRNPLGKSVREVFSEREGGVFFEMLDAVYQTGEPYIGKELELKKDLSISRATDMYVNINCHPFRDPFGRLKGVLVFFQEVTDQVLARNAIKESERYFRSLAETLPQIIWTADAKGTVNYTNGQWREYSNSFYPSHWLSFVHSEDLEKAEQAWLHSVKTGEPLEVDVRLKSKGGHYRWFLLRALATRDTQGGVVNWCGSATDIEERKIQAKELSDAKSEAERANATKSAFLANMSHEIRTPLGAILGFTELLRDAKTGEEERQSYLDIISRNGRALTRVIDDILDLSKVEAGHLEIERMPFHLPELLSEVTSLFSETVKAKNLYLTLAMDHNVPSRALSDPARLRQILINIIGNAVKFTSAGGIKVRVASQPTSPTAAKITIAVSDTGPGLMRSQQKKLFQPFTQADNTTTRKFGGTGLGLALSRRLAQAMGGNIAITECKLRRGCTFQITIEVGIPQGEENRDLSQTVDREEEEGLALQDLEKPLVKETDLQNVLSHARVLLVEDAIDNQLLIKRILTKRGAKVDVASNGMEGVTKALEGDYSIVLMDIQMPVMDGYEAIRKLRSVGYRGTVYALTAHAMAEERKKTQLAGYNGHLTKPLDTESLVEVVKQHSLL